MNLNQICKSAVNPPIGVYDNKHRDILISAFENYNAMPNPDRCTRRNLSELFNSMIAEANATARKRLSIMSACIDIPRTIAIYLAMDEISVAAPMLLYSKTLESPDLVEISGKTSMQHRLIIARRRALTPSVVRALIREGEPSVAELLLENPDLSMTDMLHWEVEAAVRSKSTLDTGAARVAVTGSNSAAQTLETVKSLATRSGQNRSPIIPVANRTAASAPHDRIVQPARQAKSISLDTKSDQRMLQHLRQNDRIGFAGELADRLRLDHTKVARLFNKPVLDTGLLLLRACGTDAPLAMRLLLFLVPDLGEDLSHLKSTIRRYMQLNPALCRKRIQFLEEEQKTALRSDGAEHARLDQIISARRSEKLPIRKDDQRKPAAFANFRARAC